MASQLSASVVTVSSFDSNLSVNPASEYTVTASLGDPTVFSFTRIGNLDGGTVDDTLSFDLVYTIYTGSSFDGTNLTLGTSVALADTTNPHFLNNYVNDPSNNAVEAGDGFTASITNLSYTSGEGFNSPTATFLGFDEITKFGGGDTDVYLGTTGAATQTVASATGTAISLGGVTNLTFTAAGSSGQRWRDLDFSFEVPDAVVAVPEPSSVALLGSLLAGCMLRRRRH